MYIFQSFDFIEKCSISKQGRYRPFLFWDSLEAIMTYFDAGGPSPGTPYGMAFL